MKTRPTLALHWQILIAMLLAVAVAAGFKLAGQSPPADTPRDGIDAWLDTVPLGTVTAVTDLVGNVFLELLKMIIMPLVLASVVMSIAGLQSIQRLRRLGLKTLAFYAMTTLLAVVVGILAVNLVRPGAGMALEAAAAPDKRPTGIDDLVLSMIPENVFGALTDNSAILSVIVFGLLLGIAMTALEDRAGPVRDFFRALEAIMMRLTDWVMRLAPLGVFALLVSVLARTSFAIIEPVSLYMATVLGGLLIHSLVVLPLIYWGFTRRNPLTYARALQMPLLTAFSTASSAATMPLTLEYTEKRGGVSRNVGGFVIPLGATVNMDGTALYEAVAAVFIAQAFGIELTFGQQVIVVFTSTLAAIGAAGVPSAGLVTMLIVLEAVGLPAEGYGLIVAVDRILDMCRTSVNVWGDMVGAAVLAHSEGELGPVDLTAEPSEATRPPPPPSPT